MRVIVLACIISVSTMTSSVAETFTCMDEGIPEKYEILGNKLRGYEDDYTGRPVVYEILENSRSGIIAIRHTPDRLIWMTIGRDGKFVRKLEFVSGSYEESNSGRCERK